MTVQIGDRIIEKVDKDSKIEIVDSNLKPSKQIIFQCRESKNGLEDDNVYFTKQLRKYTVIQHL